MTAATRERLDATLRPVWRGDSGVARCPAHRDRRPSLSVRLLPDGRALLHCYAGCEPADVLGAAGLRWSEIAGAGWRTFATPAERARRRRESAQRQAAEAAHRLRRESLAQAADAMHDRAARLAARLAAIAFAGAAPAWPGEVDDSAADYHLALAAARQMEGADGH